MRNRNWDSPEMRQHGGVTLLLISDFRNLRWAYGLFPPSSPFPPPTPSFELWMNFSGAIINATYISNIHSPLIRECLTRNGCVEGNSKIAPMGSVITVAWNFEMPFQDIFFPVYIGDGSVNRVSVSHASRNKHTRSKQIQIRNVHENSRNCQVLEKNKSLVKNFLRLFTKG